MSLKDYQTKSQYAIGVKAAKNDLYATKKNNGLSRSQLRKYADKRHDWNDTQQYKLRAKYGAKSSDYYRGCAMEYGMYAHTGKHIR